MRVDAVGQLLFILCLFYHLILIDFTSTIPFISSQYNNTRILNCLPMSHKRERHYALRGLNLHLSKKVISTVLKAVYILINELGTSHRIRIYIAV